MFFWRILLDSEFESQSNFDCKYLYTWTWKKSAPSCLPGILHLYLWRTATMYWQNSRADASFYVHWFGLFWLWWACATISPPVDVCRKHEFAIRIASANNSGKWKQNWMNGMLLLFWFESFPSSFCCKLGHLWRHWCNVRNGIKPQFLELLKCAYFGASDCFTIYLIQSVLRPITLNIQQKDFSIKKKSLVCYQKFHQKSVVDQMNDFNTNFNWQLWTKNSVIDDWNPFELRPLFENWKCLCHCSFQTEIENTWHRRFIYAAFAGWNSSHLSRNQENDQKSKQNNCR